MPLSHQPVAAANRILVITIVDCTKQHRTPFKCEIANTKIQNYSKVHQENLSFSTFSSHYRHSRHISSLLLCNIATGTPKRGRRGIAHRRRRRRPVFHGNHCGKTVLNANKSHTHGIRRTRTTLEICANGVAQPKSEDITFLLSTKGCGSPAQRGVFNEPFDTRMRHFLKSTPLHHEDERLEAERAWLGKRRSWL